MVAYWRLEEDVTQQGFSGYLDTSEYENDGTCAGSCPSLSPQGMVNNGQIFNGSDTGIDVASDPVFDFSGSDNFSIELWLKRESGIAAREVLIGRDAAAGSMHWWLGIQPTGEIAFSLTSTNSESRIIESRSQKAIANGIWHHVVAVKAANQIKLYVDGVREAVATRTYAYGFEASEPITIGYLDAGLPLHHFAGELDEIAVYNTALTENEILAHYYLSRGYCATHDTPVTVMPMGDSITYDNREGENRTAGERTGYRWPLWTWLNNAGYWVDFLGSERAGDAPQIDPPFDPDNAGFPGINDSELLQLLQTGEWYSVHNKHESYPYVSPGQYLKYYPADVLLLHIGTNDLRSEVTDVANILDQVDAYSRDITVILAQIINRVPVPPLPDPKISITAAFNDNLAAMAQQRVLDGDKLILADMENSAGLVYLVHTLEEPNGDMYDPIHPSNVVNPYVVDSGYGKMASLWFDRLQNFLPQSSPPQIVSNPVLSVNQGQTYHYDVAADGIPLTFSLTSFPPGMSINSQTGVIEWLPTSGGTEHGVTVTASNWLATDSQSFNLWVNAPPQISGIPNQQIASGMPFAAIQLDQYVVDPDHTILEMSWTTSGANELTVDISNRVAVVSVPNDEWTGIEAITFRATDPGGLFSEDTAYFSVITGNPPLVNEISNQTIEKGSNFAPINLSVTDPDNSNEEMIWSVYGNSQLIVNISQQTATISKPNAEWTGSESITFRATDPMGLYGESIATFSVKDGSDPGDNSKSSSGGSGCFIGSLVGED